jgi:O-Antigen ligase
MPPVLDRPAPRPTFPDTPVARAQDGKTGSSRLAYVLLLLATLILTPLMVLAGASQGFGEVLVALAALVALALSPWKPILSLYLLVICAVVIEQDPLTGTPIGTDNLHVFFWPVSLQGLPERPIGFFILAVLGIIICTRLLKRQRPLYGGKLFYPFIFFLGCVAIGILHGLTSGGTFRIIVLEVRPWWYLFVSYLLAFNIVSEVKHVRNILWITIIGTAVKGAQGVYIVYYYLGGHVSGHNEIMAHEQSFFFILVLLLLALMALHGVQRGFLIAILLSLPCLLIALIANNRRADYVALLAGIAVAWILVIVLKPQARRVLVAALVLCVLLGAGYVLAFQHVGGALGQPANAVISVFRPSAADARDASSNAYRAIEDYDLKYTEGVSPFLGYGFGKPFLQPQVLPDVSQLDPYYLYIPHNNVLWIWMRLGPLGFAALWNLIGTGIVCGCLIARRLRNVELQLFAILAVSALVMEVIVAYGDYQFYFYRNMIYIGIVLGVLLKLPAIARAASPEESAEPDGHPETHDARKHKTAAPPALYYAPLPLVETRTAAAPLRSVSLPSRRKRKSV